MDLPYIFLTQSGTGLSDVTLYTMWHRRLLELGIINKHSKGREYTGCGLHELWDRFRTRAQKSPAPDKDMFEFFLGHDVDPLRYNKAMDDHEYTALQYRLAEPWLNILSEDPAYLVSTSTRNSSWRTSGSAEAWGCRGSHVQPSPPAWSRLTYLKRTVKE